MTEHHEPTWLTSMIDQRLTLMRDHLPRQAPEELPLLMTPLTEPPEDATPAQIEQWDHSCDNCGRYVGTALHCGHVQRTLDRYQVIIMFGCCDDCQTDQE